MGTLANQVAAMEDRQAAFIADKNKEIASYNQQRNDALKSLAWTKRQLDDRNAELAIAKMTIRDFDEECKRLRERNEPQRRVLSDIGSALDPTLVDTLQFAPRIRAMKADLCHLRTTRPATDSEMHRRAQAADSARVKAENEAARQKARADKFIKIVCDAWEALPEYERTYPKGLEPDLVKGVKSVTKRVDNLVSQNKATWHIPPHGWMRAI
jgi:chromosome segregation ATPase